MSNGLPSGKGANENINLAEIRRRLAEGKGPQVWQSLEELAETDEFLQFLKEEFPRESSWVNVLSRREFLKLLAAPLALAGLSACLPQPQELIVPYVEAPAELVPGKPLFFATAMELDGYGRGLLVENRMGRPIKVEGNPQHPASLGATDPFAQASVLTLYDPDRSQVITYRGNIRTWDAFQVEIAQAVEALRGTQGAGLRILTETVTSPTFAFQLRQITDQFPQAKWHQYDPVGRDHVRAGAVAAFAEVVDSQYLLGQANVILSLDNDFMFREPGNLRYIREFAQRRRLTDETIDMNRLYVVESNRSITGASADHRLAMRAAQVEIFTRALASRLGIEVEAGAEELPVPDGWMDALVADLEDNRGTSLIMAGPQQTPLVHALAHAMNAALDNVGSTVYYTDPVEFNPVNQTESLRELVADLEAGQVELLIILSGNPVYSAPADLNFSEAMSRAGTSVYHGLYNNETALRSDWHIPATHYLESWSDVRAFDGTATIIQPLIYPLYNGISRHALLAALLGNFAASDREIVQEYWQTVIGAGNESEAEGIEGDATGTVTPPDQSGDTGGAEAAGSAEQLEDSEQTRFDRFWKQALRDGVIANTAASVRQVILRSDFSAFLEENPPSVPQESDPFEIVFEPDPSIWDGRFFRNAWLQELPKPITKLTWDNAALISPATAERLGLSNRDVVELSYQDRSVQAPIWILAGLPDNSVTVQLGYGHFFSDDLEDSLGFNAYTIRSSDTPWFGYGVEIRRIGGKYPLATTQDHFHMEGREIVRVTTLDQFRENPDFAQEIDHMPELPDALLTEHEEVVPEPPSLYPEYEYDGYAWGMAINLNSCVGCNACVVACQAENNIPVVGKDQVLVGREMHWIRIDRYFEGNIDDPDTLFQPMLCMHCEKAPCEPVCPVHATVHSSEGINEMVYSRCIGTRYCSNNCPYKVRRFNFYQYAEEDVIPLKLMRNPEVSVRSRGVMEKCTYCIQRINHARVEAKIGGRLIADGEVVPACAQACPANAIVFGDINDEDSEVRRLKDQPRNYGVLAEIGTQPRTTYLAVVRNPNPRIDDPA